jgi:leucyl aminopeptidase
MNILEFKERKGKTGVFGRQALTFDSGGYSIKPGRQHGWDEMMKCGAMAVLGVFESVLS